MVLILVILLSGCIAISKYQALSNLKAYGDSQNEIEVYLENQTDSFVKLEQDLKNGKLKQGIAQKAILSEYGPPIFSKEIPHDPNLKNLLLYRHPTKYFTSDKIYLYIDQTDKLYAWELVLASENE